MHSALKRTALACFLIVLFLGASAASAQDAPRIRLGMSAAFSGPSQGLGVELYRGATAWFRHMEAEHPGQAGIVIEARDDGYNPTPCIHNTIEFIQDPEILALFGYVGTPTVTRMLPLLKKYATLKPYLFFPFTGAQPQREAPYDAYVFNLRASYRRETFELVTKLVEEGITRIAVFYQADAYGRSGWDGVRRALRFRGLKIEAEATYRRGARLEDDFGQQASIITKAWPQAVISVGSYEACAGFIREMRDRGYENPIANLSFVGGMNLLNLLNWLEKDSGGNYTSGLINTQVVPNVEDESLPAVREYRRLMARHDPALPQNLASLNGGESYTPLPYSFTSFEGFLNAKVLGAIIRKAGEDPDRAAIFKAAEGLGDLEVGLDVPVHLSARDHQGLNKVYFTTVSQGRWVSIDDLSGFKR